MGEHNRDIAIILLFDSYHQGSQLLHESIKQAGYAHMAIVLQDEDFLPDGIFTWHDLILGNCTGVEQGRRNILTKLRRRILGIFMLETMNREVYLLGGMKRGRFIMRKRKKNVW